MLDINARMSIETQISKYNDTMRRSTEGSQEDLIIGYSPRQAEIQIGGETIATEVDGEHIKGVGRQYNTLDNMNRTF